MIAALRMKDNLVKLVEMIVYYSLGFMLKQEYIKIRHFLKKACRQ